LEVGGEVVYVLAVLADDQVTGCGAPGQRVTFQVGSQVMDPTAAWDNNRLWEWPLQAAAAYRIYLPLVGNHR
jgi:hypothetical protein